MKCMCDNEETAGVCAICVASNLSLLQGPELSPGNVFDGKVHLHRRVCGYSRVWAVSQLVRTVVS